LPADRLDAENDQLVPINGIPIVVLTLSIDSPSGDHATPVALSLWLYIGVVVAWLISAADTFIDAILPTNDVAFLVAVD